MSSYPFPQYKKVGLIPTSSEFRTIPELRKLCYVGIDITLGSATRKLSIENISNQDKNVVLFGSHRNLSGLNFGNDKDVIICGLDELDMRSTNNYLDMMLETISHPKQGGLLRIINEQDSACFPAENIMMQSRDQDGMDVTTDMNNRFMGFNQKVMDMIMTDILMNGHWSISFRLHRLSKIDVVIFLSNKNGVVSPS